MPDLADPHNRQRFILSAGVLLAACGLMGQMGPVGKAVFLFAPLYGAGFLGLLGIVKWFPENAPAGRQFLILFALAILCRLCFLAFPTGNDINRYIWEGAVFQQGINPYMHPPAAPLLQGFLPEIHPGINHKELTAGYPPLAILFFALLALLSHEPLFYKGVLVLFDLLAIPLLALMLHRRRTGMKHLALYALNPLVLLFIAGESHLDALQLFCVVLTLFCFDRKRPGLGFFCLGCAVMFKYYAIVILPCLIDRQNWKKSALVLLPMAAYLPFLEGGTGFFASLITFGTRMHYNDAVPVILRAVLGPGAVWGSVALLSGGAVLILLLEHDRLRSSFLMVGLLMLCLPTLHPWYLTLLTPFLVFYPSRAWLYLHFGVVFTFAVFHQEYYTGVFQEVYWLKPFEYLPFFGLLIYDTAKNRGTAPGRFRPVGRVSVVIPTLDAARHLPRALASIRRQTGLLEVMGVDAGSTDATLEIFRDHHVPVFHSPRGRGIQIARGVRQCRGDVIFVMHADCHLRPDAFARIIELLNRRDDCIGGALGMQYQNRTARARLLEMLNNGRARWTGISFGDQGQFFRQAALASMGGFPAQMLMEDIEISFRMKANGRVAFIPSGIVVQSSRWDQQRFLATFKRDILLCLSYLVQRRMGMADRLHEKFYHRYYGPDTAGKAHRTCPKHPAPQRGRQNYMTE